MTEDPKKGDPTFGQKQPKPKGKKGKKRPPESNAENSPDHPIGPEGGAPPPASETHTRKTIEEP